MGYKKITAQDIELLKNFSENIRLYGGIRSTFSAFEKVDDKYAEEIDKLYSDAIMRIYLKDARYKTNTLPWWAWVPQTVTGLIAIIISVVVLK